MKEKELDALVEALWRRIEAKLASGAEREARFADGVPDAETRLAIWLQMTRGVRLAKDVDLREFALRYPVTEKEIMTAVKTMTHPGSAPAARRKEYTARQLKDSLIKVLGYSVLASRETPGDEKPTECPSEKKYEKRAGSWCHEQDKEKGDFICRGDEKKGRDFVCTPGPRYGFYCQKPQEQQKFVCDANDSGDKFECVKGSFLCDRSEGPFYCQRKESGGFACGEDKKDKDQFVCKEGEHSEFKCPAKDKGAGFNDKCFEHQCFPAPRGSFGCEKTEKSAGFQPS